MSMTGQHDHQRPAVKSQVKGYDEVTEPYRTGEVTVRRNFHHV
jgi:hypothetical protein